MYNLNPGTKLDVHPALAKAAIRFSPMAWAKAQFLCHHCKTEISMIGLSAEDDLFLIEDVIVLKQYCDVSSSDYDEDAMMDHIMDLGMKKIPQERAMRIFIHTHPGSSATPSSTDESTWRSEFFRRHPWQVMLIIARGGEVYTRLRVQVESNELPGLISFVESRIPAYVDATWTNPKAPPAVFDPEAMKKTVSELVRPYNESPEQIKLAKEGKGKYQYGGVYTGKSNYYGGGSGHTHPSTRSGVKNYTNQGGRWVPTDSKGKNGERGYYADFDDDDYLLPSHSGYQQESSYYDDWKDVHPDHRPAAGNFSNIEDMTEDDYTGWELINGKWVPVEDEEDLLLEAEWAEDDVLLSSSGNGFHTGSSHPLDYPESRKSAYLWLVSLLISGSKYVYDTGYAKTLVEHGVMPSEDQVFARGKQDLNKYPEFNEEELREASIDKQTLINGLHSAVVRRQKELKSTAAK